MAYSYTAADMVVRQAQTPDDYDQILALLKATWPDAYVHPLPDAGTLLREQDRRKAQVVPGGLSRLIAVDPIGTVVGTVALVPWTPAPTDVIELGQGAVAEDAQGAGVFDALLDEAERRCAGASAVFASSVPHHRKTICALAKRGYKTVGHELGLCPPGMLGTASPSTTVLQMKRNLHRTSPPFQADDPRVEIRGRTVVGYALGNPSEWPHMIERMKGLAHQTFTVSRAHSSTRASIPHTLQLWFSGPKAAAAAQAMGLCVLTEWVPGHVTDCDWPLLPYMIQKPVGWTPSL